MLSFANRHVELLSWAHLLIDTWNSSFGLQCAYPHVPAAKVIEYVSKLPPQPGQQGAPLGAGSQKKKGPKKKWPEGKRSAPASGDDGKPRWRACTAVLAFSA